MMLQNGASLSVVLLDEFVVIHPVFEKLLTDILDIGRFVSAVSTVGNIAEAGVGAIEEAPASKGNIKLSDLARYARSECVELVFESLNLSLELGVLGCELGFLRAARALTRGSVVVFVKQVLIVILESGYTL
jgi:hypothetical protein